MPVIQNNSYDYIITGAGCAGLSLLLQMLQHPFFKDKKILLIDADDKKKNDRTWCFWEILPGIFEEIVYKQWEQINFYSNSFSGRWDITPYRYKMIRGQDLYEYAFRKIASYSNIIFRHEKVQKVYSDNSKAYVQTEVATFTADYVFNSILFQPELLKTKNSLLQHFKGWMIETHKEEFNSNIATFMDFRLHLPEENTFVYVLPVNSRKALIEYTVLSPSLLSDEKYTDGLKKYISEFLNITNYVVTEEEFGVIPMSTFTFVSGSSPVVNVGTAGGQTKSSSGYTFQFIQKQSAGIVNSLIANEHPGRQNRFFDKRFKMYDDTLLSVLASKKLTAAQIFSDLFKHNKPQQIFKFLDNETTVGEELKIMSSVPSHIFMPAAFIQFFS